jgi:hypothetical protein
MNPLPPQAFTKDTLQKAYVWLLSQPAGIKEMASTQDMLISLYLKAQRNGEASLEAPSIQNFKQELKSLAGMIGDFSPNGNSATTPSSNTSVQNNSLSSTNVAALIAGLDQQSSNAILEVKQNLNLSSDVEALRALIALGYKQLKKI